MKNPVAKNMNTFNRSSVVPHKRDKYLDELAERERGYCTVSDEPDLEWDDEDDYRSRED